MSWLVFLLSLLPISAWAFPDTGVLENFTGSDNTSPPNSNWTNGLVSDATCGIRIRSNAIAPGSTDTDCGGYWNVSSFNEDCEAYATITTEAASAYPAVACRLQNIGNATTDGYQVTVNATADEIWIQRIDNGSGTTLGAAISQTVTTGSVDKLGLRAEGDQICAWFNDGGAGWAEIGCRTDATYTGGGRIGIVLYGSANLGYLDDFGGGNIAAAAPSRRPIAPMIFSWLDWLIPPGWRLVWS